MMMISEESIGAFVDSMRRAEKSERTVEKYARDVHALQVWNADEISKETVIAYKKYLTEKGYAKRSINSMLCSVNAYLDFMGWGECKVKLLKMQKETFCRAEKELTKAEFERLCHAAQTEGNKRLYLLLQTLCGTGIRVSELPFITVEAVRCGAATVTLKGKTRTVFIVKELRKKLLAYAKERGITAGQIFRTSSGRSLNRTNIWREMKGLCRKAKVEPGKVFPHNLRHLFARAFYAVKQDIAKLADILGHSSIETTRVYIVSTGREHRRLMEKMKLVS